MHKIQMVDLKGQHEKIKSEIDTAIGEVIDNTAFINGSAIKKFASNLEAYTGVAHVIPCGNGTEALHVALMALDLKPGDEVITSSFTFISTAEVIALMNLKPVFVDVDPDTFNLDPEKIKNAISEKTRAIIPVHIFGQCADMDPIMEIADQYDLKVVEDNCQAVGAKYLFSGETFRHAGTIGDIGAVSFFPSKNLGAYGDGGAVYTNDDEKAEMLRAIVNHGSFKKYYHEYVGLNSRLDTMQAAILDVKLKYLDQYVEARQKAARFYDDKLWENSKIQIPARTVFSTHTFHQYTLKLDDSVNRENMQAFLKEQGIPSVVYYPIPLHLQKPYRVKGREEGSLPVIEDLSRRVLSLPMHTELDEEQLEFITDKVNEYTEN